MAHLPPPHGRLSPERVRERLAVSRQAARSAERESLAVKADVERLVAQTRHCLRSTADLLSPVRRRLQP